MEGILLDVTAASFGASAVASLVLVGIFTAIHFLWMAAEEREGARLLWAEWPLPKAAPAPRLEEVRRAA